MALIEESLADGHLWWRIAEASWADPLDPSYAMRQGGRWNPPGSFPTLYLNEDRVTARLNLRRFIARWPYEPEDLRNDTGPILTGARLPRGQVFCDCHTRKGVAAAGLPPTYPWANDSTPVPHGLCQGIGLRARSEGLRGVRARSAPSPDGAGRELAWFPATVSSKARSVRRLSFEDWFWG